MARQHDPRRMLWGFELSVRVLRSVQAYRERRAASGLGRAGSGPWASHEALVIDYEDALIRGGGGSPVILASTHLPRSGAAKTIWLRMPSQTNLAMGLASF